MTSSQHAGAALGRMVVVNMVLLAGAAAGAAESTFGAAADNTLIQVLDPNAPRSNGRGDSVFTGLTQRDGLRRAVLRFDLSVIPPGATVQSATLTLTLTHTRPGSSAIKLHRSLQDWGEGASSAFGGIGTVAEPGDVTWFERFRLAQPPKIGRAHV